MLCPSCLGIGHLREALTTDACFNCVSIPLAERSARLAMVESNMPMTTFASSPRKGSKRRKRPHADAPSAKKDYRDHALSAKVETLASEFAQIKSLLLNLQPNNVETSPVACASESCDTDSSAVVQPDEDTMSIAASESLFRTDSASYMEDHGGGCHSPNPSVVNSHTSEPESPLETGPVLSHVKQAIQLALSRLGIDVSSAEAAPASAFFKITQRPEFIVPVSQPYIEELHRCWADPKSSTHLPQDCRALSSMQDSGQYGLNRMPSVDSVIANLVVSPADAARPDARCPRPQCRVTDELLTKSYDIAARIGRLGNSFSHLGLALSQSLKDAGVDEATQSLSDASLQTFAYMSRELGRLMSTLTITRRQVWLAQSPLSESCRGTLRSLPVVPGQVFGPAAQQTLERAVEANKSRQQFADLRQAPRPQPRRPGSFQSVARTPSSQGNTRAFEAQSRARQPPQRSAFRVPTSRPPRNDRNIRRDRPLNASGGRGRSSRV